MNYKKIKKEFDSLDEQEQWSWLLKCGVDYQDSIQINLDNDSTDISFINEEDAPLMYFKAYIGNSQGVEYILKALGFNVESV